MWARAEKDRLIRLVRIVRALQTARTSTGEARTEALEYAHLYRDREGDAVGVSEMWLNDALKSVGAVIDSLNAIVAERVAAEPPKPYRVVDLSVQAPGGVVVARCTSEDVAQKVADGFNARAEQGS